MGALTLFLNDRTEEFTTWLYQMLDNIRKRREKQKESDEKGPEKAKENNNEKDEVKGHDELEIGVGTQDDLDRELIGRDDKKSERKSDKKDDKASRAKGKSVEPKK